jgi:hypothetical protein
MSKTVSIHQPNYIPWAGYFYKIARSDVFVVLDAVQYPRGQSFAARNRIKTPNGPAFLTIRVHIPKGREGKVLYTDVIFSDTKWKEKHLKTLSLNYKKASHFQEVYELIEPAIRTHDKLADLNLALIRAIADYLEIRTGIVLLSDILHDFGQKTDLIVDICKRLDADVYLSGTGGGKAYNDEALLNENQIQLVYSDFTHPEYPQLWGEFIPNLSILDMLFNCGRQSRELLHI